MSAKMMKLFLTGLSPNSRRAEAMVYKLKLEGEVEVKRVDFKSGYHQSAEFLAINPNGKLPVLVHERSPQGQSIIWESIAIMHYLADSQDTPEAKDFFPVDFISRTETTRWELWGELHFNKPIGAICWETVAKPFMGLGDADQDAIEFGRQEFHRFAKVLNSHLEQHQFLLGEKLTLADFALGAPSHLVLHPNSQVPYEQYEALTRWYKALEADPAWSKSRPA